MQLFKRFKFFRKKHDITDTHLCTQASTHKNCHFVIRYVCRAKMELLVWTGTLDHRLVTPAAINCILPLSKMLFILDFVHLAVYNKRCCILI